MPTNKQASKQANKETKKQTIKRTNKTRQNETEQTEQNRAEKQTNKQPIESDWVIDWLIASLPDWLTDAFISICYPCLLVWQWPFQRNSIISSRQLASKYDEGFYVYCVCVMDIAGEIVALKVQTRTGQVEVQLLNLEDSDFWFECIIPQHKGLLHFKGKIKFVHSQGMMLK